MKIQEYRQVRFPLHWCELHWCEYDPVICLSCEWRLGCRILDEVIEEEREGKEKK